MVAMVIFYVVINLPLMVDICLCCNQTLYYWKMPFLAGDVQGSCTILEVENISTITTQQYTHTRCYTHHDGTWGRADMTSIADSSVCAMLWQVIM